ncbi:MAG TPA: hypothetical protein DCR93_13305 [Cytophagales bacterium]|nr:hypothetical protein [Cytophagales bacterium]HAP60419.1 hypothetical protein [Cytophagales bacterium]
MRLIGDYPWTCIIQSSHKLLKYKALTIYQHALIIERSGDAAQNTAVITSRVGLCEKLGINPQEDLKKVIMGIVSHPIASHPINRILLPNKINIKFNRGLREA